MNDEIRELGVNRAWFAEPDILHVEYGTEAHRQGAVFTHADALDGESLVKTCLGAGPVVMIADIRNLRKTTRKARKIQPEEAEAVVAILVGCAVTRMIANAYLGLTRPTHITRVFSDEKNALTWLRQKARGQAQGEPQAVAG